MGLQPSRALPRRPGEASSDGCVPPNALDSGVSPASSPHGPSFAYQICPSPDDATSRLDDVVPWRQLKQPTWSKSSGGPLRGDTPISMITVRISSPSFSVPLLPLSSGSILGKNVRKPHARRNSQIPVYVEQTVFPCFFSVDDYTDLACSNSD